MQEQLGTAQKLIDTLIEFCVNYSFQVFGAIIILIIGFLLAGWLASFVLKLCGARKMDIALSRFLAGAVKGVIIIFAVIIALGKFGITMAPFIAMIGAAAFGATYAIQGPLSNYGAGLSIILGRSFSIGDTITVAGVSGVVDDIKLANTILIDEDGVKITIPNKHIVGEIVQNSKGFKVVEAVVGVSYDCNPELALKIVKNVLSSVPEVQKNPSFHVGIQAFGDSSINIGYRYWVPTVKFFQISGAVNLEIFKALQAAGISIPFPQREVRILSQQQSFVKS